MVEIFINNYAGYAALEAKGKKKVDISYPFHNSYQRPNRFVNVVFLMFIPLLRLQTTIIKTE